MNCSLLHVRTLLRKALFFVPPAIVKRFAGNGFAAPDD